MYNYFRGLSVTWPVLYLLRSTPRKSSPVTKYLRRISSSLLSRFKSKGRFAYQYCLRVLVSSGAAYVLYAIQVES